MGITFFLCQRFLSMLAFQMRSVAIGWYVYDTTQSALDLGLTGLAQFLPMLVLSPIAGQVADRLDRKQIVKWTLVADAAISAMLYSVTRSNHGSVRGVFLCLILAGAVRPFISSSGQALIPAIVPREGLPKAIAWNANTWHISMVVGPMIGGILYGWSNAAWVFLSSSVLTVTALLLLVRIHPKAQRREIGTMNFESYLSGIFFILKNRVILGAISLDLFAVLLGGAVALLPIIAKDILHVGPEGLGLLRAAPGLGAVITGVILARYPIRRHTGKTMLICVALFGLFTIGFGISTNFYASLLFLFLLGAADLVSVVIRAMMVQLMTPDEMRGRVSAVNFVFIGTSNELGEFESGLTASWWGATPAVIVGGVGTLAIVALWNKLFPELKSFDRF